ncbi:MAG: exo-alpha-sialidase [Massilibacteroides sp.]|nr:exo-alpha-sialidase [Massilibacteroides sp.]MDD3063242.1 exo-alpha-sialidase [Massilibacteroides sp.]MDD4116169.1 exo-alpha-sialidase [Massilibacteroides sp.]MDD4661168.1 exo-alpha-sialidase [Massilibacteroides sp.]
MSCSNYTTKIRLSNEQPILPVLTWKETNPILKITLIKNSETKNYTLDEVFVSLQGTSDINDIESICLFANGEKEMISVENPLTSPLPPANPVIFKEKVAIETDTFSFWLSVKLKEKVDLTHRICASCIHIKTNLGRIRVGEAASSKPLRVGVAVRQHGQDGMHTSRIPGLATSKKGTLLAIYDARYESARDLQGNMDIALNRSMDGGQAWQPRQIVLDRKEWGSLPEKYNGVSDACILVDENSGNIYVAGLWMHGVLDQETGKWVKGLTKDSTRWIHQWREKGSQPGFGVKETSQFLITKSTDDGATWSEPINITTCKKREWWLFAPAPGHGITLKDGTLVFPTQGRDKNGQPFSNITWSKDGGKTWTTSEPAYHNTTECMAVELSDGSVMLNMRDNRNRGNAENNGRRICTTNDLGKTWTEHPTSRKALIEPTCMASIHRHEYTENGEKKSLLLFVNPSSISKRDHITLKVSFDDGISWPEDHWIVLDEYSGRGYSCITSVDEKTIGILYESSQADLVFQQIKMEEVK